MIKIKNNFFTGLFGGSIAPVLAFLVYTKLKFPDVSILTVMRHVHELGLLATIISLSVFINLLVFFLFIWNHADHSAKGVLGATLIYAFIVLILKLV